MRIESARVLNYTSLHSAIIDFPASSNAVLVCGPNGAGKTSLLRALRFALSGELPDGVRYKKDLSEIVSQGEKKGHISVTLADGVRSEEYTMQLPSGTYADATPPQVNPFGLNPASFMALEPNQRRSAVFQLAGISLKASDIVADLVRRGHGQEWVDMLKPGIQGGLASARKLADQLTSEARGSWQAVTGEKYGSVKAESWAAEKPATVDIAPITESMKRYQASRTSAQQLLAELRAADRAHVDAQAKRAESEKLESLDLDVGQVERKLEASQERIAELRAVVDGERKGWTAECPCCGSMLYCGEVGKLEEVTPEHNTSPAVARAGLEAERGVLAQLQIQLAGAKSKAASARAARMFIENLGERPTPEELRKAESVVTELDADIAIVAANLNAANDANSKAAQAEVITKRAAGYHSTAQAMTKLADELEKLPGEYIKRAMEPINAALAEASRLMGLGSQVSMTADMELRYGSLPYHRVSESQQWRCELALGLALADGGIVLMDRFDCIQPKDRGAILVALGAQTRAQVIVSATLKAQPEALPPGMTAHWLG